MIKGLNKGKPVIEITCGACGTEYESKYNRGKMKKFLAEFNEYENHMTEPCTNCGASMFINLNLPQSELSEEFFNSVGMPENERAERRVIRELMLDENIS